MLDAEGAEAELTDPLDLVEVSRESVTILAKVFVGLKLFLSDKACCA